MNIKVAAFTVSEKSINMIHETITNSEDPGRCPHDDSHCLHSWATELVIKKYRRGTVNKNILLEGLNRYHGDNLTLTKFSSVSAFTHLFWYSYHKQYRRYNVNVQTLRTDSAITVHVCRIPEGGYSLFCIRRLGPSIYPSPQKNIRNFKHLKKKYLKS